VQCELHPAPMCSFKIDAGKEAKIYLDSRVAGTRMRDVAREKSFCQQTRSCRAYASVALCEQKEALQNDRVFGKLPSTTEG
jgi:hypothetical protein